jgi:hypothetical protein
MRQPDLVRAVFAELRRNLSSDVSDGDALRLAHLIIKSYTEERDLLADFGIARASRSLLHTEVDEAMKDGGWRVMEFEGEGFSTPDDRGPRAGFILQTLLERFIGPEWRHHQWIGPL